MFYDRSTCAFFFITLGHFSGISRTHWVAPRLQVMASTSPHFDPLATCCRAFGPLAPILPLGRNNCKISVTKYKIKFFIKAINLVSRTPPSPFPSGKCPRSHCWQRTMILVECASSRNCSRSNRSIEVFGLTSTSSLSDVQNKIFTWHHVLYLDSPNSSCLGKVPIA